MDPHKTSRGQGGTGVFIECSMCVGVIGRIAAGGGNTFCS
jgi:hypothetical protein